MFNLLEWKEISSRTNNGKVVRLFESMSNPNSDPKLSSKPDPDGNKNHSISTPLVGRVYLPQRRESGWSRSRGPAAWAGSPCPPGRAGTQIRPVHTVCTLRGILQQKYRLIDWLKKLFFTFSVRYNTLVIIVYDHTLTYIIISTTTYCENYINGKAPCECGGLQKYHTLRVNA